MSPAESRDILGLQDQCMVSFGGGEISNSPSVSMTFGDIARFAKDGLFAVKSRENLTRTIDLQSAAVSSNRTVDQASQLKRNAFNSQVMLTNLGRLPFDNTFGPLKLETLWASCHFHPLPRATLKHSTRSSPPTCAEPSSSSRRPRSTSPKAAASSPSPAVSSPETPHLRPLHRLQSRCRRARPCPRQ